MDAIDKEVAERRKNLGDPSLPAGSEHIWGLALSGGGIRSATFCFGLMRSLAHQRLLLRFDLMSTVSGGGYIGATVGTLFSRASNGAEAQQVQQAIDGQAPNSDSTQLGADKPTSWFLWWLRANGRYLIPRGAKDSTFAFALFLRNLAGIHLELGLIAVLLGMILSTVDLAVWWGVEQAGYRVPTSDFFDLVRWLPNWLPTISVALPIFALAAVIQAAAYWAVPWVQPRLPERSRVRSKVSSVPPPPMQKPPKRHRSPWFTYVGVLLADVGLSYLFYEYGQTSTVGSVLRNITWWTCASLIALWVLGAIAAGRELHASRTAESAALQADTARNKLTKRFAQCLRLISLVALAGLVDRVAWFIAFKELSVVHAGLLLALAAAVLRALAPLASSATASGATGSGAVLFLGRIGGYLLTFLLASWWVSLVYQAVLGSLFSGNKLNYSDAWRVLGLLAIPVLSYMFWTGRNLTFLNLSSLNSFYRARLVRSYMGAANWRRFGAKKFLGAMEVVQTLMPLGKKGSSIDDVWPDDDLHLTSYKPQSSGGPVHLINVCVNQTRDPRGQLFNQDRRGLPLTVASGGQMRVSQEPWVQLTKTAGMSVGRWISVSGAAVAPGMGAQTRGGLAALMTFAGVRLGYWWSEAERKGDPNARALSLLSKSKGLLDELFGNFKGTAAPDWFLTDGGHFENTAAYALLAQRAEVIVVADCGADPNYKFCDLENLVRIARVDLQADIRFQRPKRVAAASEVDESKLRNKNRLRSAPRVDRPKVLESFGSINDLASPEGSACLAMARVVYGGDKPKDGILILIKPNICSGLPVDLINFKGQYPDFPQQPTSDQFFSEAQWESYFLLGQFLGKQLSREFIERIVANPHEFFENDDCSPVEQKTTAGQGNVGTLKQTIAAAGRLPARISASAVGTTIGLGAAATIGVSVWQAIDSARTSFSKKTNEERAALKELTELWAKVPAVSYSTEHDKESSMAISNLAAAIVRTADALCPGDEAKWYRQSPVAAQITNDAIFRCKDLSPGQRSSACSMLLEGTNPELRGPLPKCLSWQGDKKSVPPPLYWGYDYSVTRPIDYWHPCDPARWDLVVAEWEHFQVHKQLLGRATDPAFGKTQRLVEVPVKCRMPQELRDLVKEKSALDSPTGAFAVATAARASASAATVPTPPVAAPTASAPAAITSATSEGSSSAAPPAIASEMSVRSTAAGVAPSVAPAATSGPPALSTEQSGLASAYGATAQVGSQVPVCETSPVPVFAQGRYAACKDISVYVQIYDAGQKPLIQCYKRRWKAWFDAEEQDVDDVVAKALSRHSTVPSPVPSAVVRYHRTDARECALAIASTLGESARVQQLGSGYKSVRKTLEVWVPPDLRR